MSIQFAAHRNHMQAANAITSSDNPCTFCPSYTSCSISFSPQKADHKDREAEAAEGLKPESSVVQR
jgi:hypothetical protein